MNGAVVGHFAAPKVNLFSKIFHKTPDIPSQLNQTPQSTVNFSLKLNEVYSNLDYAL